MTGVREALRTSGARGRQATPGIAPVDGERRGIASRAIVWADRTPTKPAACTCTAPMPTGFDWAITFQELQRRHLHCHECNDTYGARAISAAIAAIQAKVMTEYNLLLKEPVSGVVAAYRMLSAALNSSASPATLAISCNALRQALQSIDDLTSIAISELDLRARELAVSVGEATPHGETALISKPMELENRLRHQADLATADMARALDTRDTAEAQAAWYRCFYFQQLRREHLRGNDPWMASRYLIQESARRGMQYQAQEMRIAHLRLLLAMGAPCAHGPAAPPKTVDHPGVPVSQPPNGARTRQRHPYSLSSDMSNVTRPTHGPAPASPVFTWSIAYFQMKALHDRCLHRGDLTTAHAVRVAIEFIDAKVMEAFHAYVPMASEAGVVDTEVAYGALCLTGIKVGLPEGHGTLEDATVRALATIDRLTGKQLSELTRRAGEQQPSTTAPGGIHKNKPPRPTFAAPE